MILKPDFGIALGAPDTVTTHLQKTTPTTAVSGGRGAVVLKPDSGTALGAPDTVTTHLQKTTTRAAAAADDNHDGQLLANVKAVTQMVVDHFHVPVNFERVLEIVLDAFKITDDDYGVQEACKWAEESGWTGFPRGALATDYELLRAAGRSLVKMAARRLQQLSGNRLNRERVEATISSNNPYRARLMQLAVEGIIVPQPEGFRPNGKGPHPPLRKKYQAAHPAVNKMVYELHQQGLAFLFTKSVAEEVVQQLSPSGWTSKKKKRQGRATLDGDSKLPNSSLNGDEAKRLITDIYGPIHHPTLETIVTMILEYFEESGCSWEELVLWKKDLRGAFNLISFRPADVPLMATELIDEQNPNETVVMVFLCGIFGWTGTPAAFHVVSGALQHELRPRLIGRALIYVDDLMGVCRLRDVVHDMDEADKLCTGLLGPDAVADDKNECSRRLDTIGYTLDLDRMRATIARKNFRNTLYGFFSVDTTQLVPVRVLERLASWSSRYAFICRALRPFNKDLYTAFAGRNRLTSVRLQPRAQLAICLWRSVLVALHLDEERFAKPFDSFAKRPIRLVIETDASLKGAGCVVYTRSHDGSTTARGCSALSLRALEFGVDSGYQNCAEFIGILAGFRTARKLGYTDLEVELRTDSAVALSWAEDEKFRGDHVTNASIVFVQLMLTTGTQVTSTHIDKTLNTKCDALSRLHETPNRTAGSLMNEWGMGHCPFLDLDSDELVTELLQLCDPNNNVLESDNAAQCQQQLKQFWGQAGDLVNRF